ncbi:MAG: UDP-N-acetylmuramoyl-L-alanine--D-glutamate ligase [Litorivicinus sp.]
MQLIASSYTLVLGLGIAGQACARHLVQQGVAVQLADTRDAVAGFDALMAACPGVPCRLGHEVTPEWVAQASEIVVSPGIGLDDPVLAQARARDIPLIGELDLLRRAAPDIDIVAITGTNGKSTVTTLVGEMLAASGVRVAVGGNLGRPMLDLLSDEADLLVLELSSFQLERAQPFSPRVATVLNMTPDHLDRHGDMVSYYKAKHRVFTGAQACVVNHEDALSRPLVGENLTMVEFSAFASDFRRFGIEGQGAERAIYFSLKPVIAVNELAMLGEHNLSNAMAALGIVQALGLELTESLGVLRRFTGLPHRGVVVGAIDGVPYINDSKGTNEGASVAALTGLAAAIDGRVFLLAGGDGKGSNFAALGKAINRTQARVIGFGRDGASIISAAGDGTRCETLDEALALARSLAVAGDAVLLSPACASFDQFPNYVARGEHFEAWVRGALA